MAAYTKIPDDRSAYVVGITHLNAKSKHEKEYLVVVSDPTQGKVSCGCQQFERVGILCSHALKILDLMNIKQLPEHYVLKRWTREAQCGVVHDMFGRHVVEDPKQEASRRYKLLSQRFNSLASRATNSDDCFVFLDNALYALEKQMEEKWEELSTRMSHSNIQSTSQMPENTSQMPENVSVATRLKKKDEKM